MWIYADTSKIQLDAFDTEEKAKIFIKKIVPAHKDELKKLGKWKDEWDRLDDIFLKPLKRKQLRGNFINFYEGNIIRNIFGRLSREIKKELVKAGKNVGDNLVNEICDDIVNSIGKKGTGRFSSIVKKLLNSGASVALEYKRRRIERDRADIALGIIDGLILLEKSSFNENPFGDGTDIPNIEEEYCYVCEKIIDENDDRKLWTRSSVIKASFCSQRHYDRMDNSQDDHAPFHDCSSCSRFIPKSIGNTCQTCKSRKGEPDEEEDNSQVHHICPKCRQSKPWGKNKRRWNSGFPYLCSEDCLFNWLRDEQQIFAKRCSKCKRVKKDGETMLDGWRNEKGNFYCSSKCFSGKGSGGSGEGGFDIRRARQKFLQELTGLLGWEELTEDEKDQFKDMIKNGYSDKEFEKAILKAQILISEKLGDTLVTSTPVWTAYPAALVHSF